MRERAVSVSISGGVVIRGESVSATSDRCPPKVDLCPPDWPTLWSPHCTTCHLISAPAPAMKEKANVSFIRILHANHFNWEKSSNRFVSMIEKYLSQLSHRLLRRAFVNKCDVSGNGFCELREIERDKVKWQVQIKSKFYSILLPDILLLGYFNAWHKDRDRSTTLCTIYLPFYQHTHFCTSLLEVHFPQNNPFQIMKLLANICEQLFECSPLFLNNCLNECSPWMSEWCLLTVTLAST